MANLEQTIDCWTIEKFDPAWNPTGMLEVSSFSRLFPQYRANYLYESWPIVESALNEFGVECNLNLEEGSMTVATTSKTRDPYIIVKARDLLRLLSRSVPAPQAIKILKDDMYYDIINTRNLARKKERFVTRRQRLSGPNSRTLKMLESLTECYIKLQGTTVAAMGSFQGIRQVRKIVEECMLDIMHPLHRLNIAMMKKALANDSTRALVETALLESQPPF